MAKGAGLTVGLYSEMISFMRELSETDATAKGIMKRYDDRLDRQHAALKNETRL